MREEEAGGLLYLADSSWKMLSVLSWETWDPYMPQGTGKSLTWEMAKIYTSLVSFSFQFKYYQYVIGASKYTHIHTQFFLVIAVVSFLLFFFSNSLFLPPILSHSCEAPIGMEYPLWMQILPGWNFRQLFPNSCFHLATVSEVWTTPASSDKSIS